MEIKKQSFALDATRRADAEEKFTFWAEHNREMLGVSSRLVVLALDGWRESVGVAAEIEIARELGLPVEFEAPVEVARG